MSSATFDKKCVVFENFLKAQIKYVEDSKYFEGINKNYDPGEKFILEWVKTQANNFRARWDDSKCKLCTSGGKCGDKLKKFCEGYEEL